MVKHHVVVLLPTIIAVYVWHAVMMMCLCLPPHVIAFGVSVPNTRNSHASTRNNHETFHDAQMTASIVRRKSVFLQTRRNRLLVSPLHHDPTDEDTTTETIHNEDDTNNNNNNDTPLVSVMMVTYERPRLLRHALRQLTLQQNVGGGLQVVVVDDSRGGPDNVAELQDCLSMVASSSSDQNHHHTTNKMTLVYYYSETRMEIGAKRNKAVELASAPFVIQVDDDDLYSPHRIAYQLEPLLQNNDNNNSNNRADITMLQQHTWACLDPHSNDHPQFYEATEQFQQHCHYGTLCFSKHIYPTVHYPKDSSLGEDLAFVECAKEQSVVVLPHKNRTSASTECKVVTKPPTIVLLSNQDDHHVYVRHGGATNVGHDLSRDSRFKPVQRLDLMKPLQQVALHLPSLPSLKPKTSTAKNNDDGKELK